MDDDELDEMRRRMQESLIQAKRDQLAEEHGGLLFGEGKMPPEMEMAWLDSVLEFEQKFENAQLTTVRERLGNPEVKSVDEVPLYALEEALDELLELLATENITVDFMGEWDVLDAYRFITEELLDEEIDDVHIEDMWTHFPATTAVYDVEMWVDDFARHLLLWEQADFLQNLGNPPLLDMAGEVITAARLASFWAKVGEVARVNVEPVVTQVAGEEGECTAVVKLLYEEDAPPVLQVEAFFRLHPSPYTGWDVIQTSLIDDILAYLS